MCILTLQLFFCFYLLFLFFVIWRVYINLTLQVMYLVDTPLVTESEYWHSISVPPVRGSSDTNIHRKENMKYEMEYPNVLRKTLISHAVKNI